MEISANYYPINKEQVIKLLSFDDLEKVEDGTTLYSITGDRVIKGKSKLDLQTRMFQHSKYGVLIPKKELKIPKKGS